MPASTAIATIQAEVARKKTRAMEIRASAEQLFRDGRTGIQIAEHLAEAVDALILEFIHHAFADCSPRIAEQVARDSAVIAVGGTGRGELAPFSDIDLLFLESGKGSDVFRAAVSQVVQSCWDAKLELGHSIRTVADCVSMARQNAEIATSLTEARLLWGNPELFESLQRQFRRKVIDRRRTQFVNDCLAARAEEWPEPGVPALELQPNIKRSLGGLRDLHLMRWLGFALFESGDIDSLRLHGAITSEEAGLLRGAWEFLTRIRIDLHLSAGREQDILNSDEQLRIASDRGFESDKRQRAVEKFMQGYFRHSADLASVSRRFVERHRPRPLFSTLKARLFSHRADGVLRVSGEHIDASPRHYPQLCASPESMLRVYKSAALYGTLPSAGIIDAIRSAIPDCDGELSPEASQLFLDILNCTTHLGPILRSMYDAGLLEYVIPDMRHARCLMQFNQYHHYTVDEHTLRAAETAGRFIDDDGPVGSAYRTIRRKHLLHLALILHDLGKGFDESHSEVGRRIALRIADRLHLPQQQCDQLVLLVHKHLLLSHNAFRRDITDPALLVQFSRDVGSPETFRMLYVLTVADVMAVGPGNWTDWKEELVTELFDRCMLILSGRHYSYHEQEQLNQVKRHVAHAVAPFEPGTDARTWQNWIDRQLSGFSAYYLTCTPPERIAGDLDLLQRLNDDEIHVTGTYSADTDTVDYRVITRDPVATRGCFHRISGVLTASRMDILAADINTTRDGVVVDNFRVVDQDFDDHVPDHRIDEITNKLRKALTRNLNVRSLFKQSRRISPATTAGGLSNLRSRVAIDNDSSDSRTIIDVFAHDRRGLLYIVARALNELNLSVDLAKISTHYDQVVDVFYVQEADGTKIDDARLDKVHDTLSGHVAEFEGEGYRQFAGQ